MENLILNNSISLRSASVCLLPVVGNSLPEARLGDALPVFKALVFIPFHSTQFPSSFGDAQFSSHLCCQWLSAWGNLVTGFDSQNRHLYEDRIVTMLGMGETSEVHQHPVLLSPDHMNKTHSPASFCIYEML